MSMGYFQVYWISNRLDREEKRISLRNTVSDFVISSGSFPSKNKAGEILSPAAYMLLHTVAVLVLMRRPVMSFIVMFLFLECGDA